MRGNGGYRRDQNKRSGGWFYPADLYIISKNYLKFKAGKREVETESLIIIMQMMCNFFFADLN